jgi:serine-type D-Ala-D-Ala endopeptidase (penicillin-binding protein 7)
VEWVLHATYASSTAKVGSLDIERLLISAHDSKYSRRASSMSKTARSNVSGLGVSMANLRKMNVWQVIAALALMLSVFTLGFSPTVADAKSDAKANKQAAKKTAAKKSNARYIAGQKLSPKKAVHKTALAKGKGKIRHTAYQTSYQGRTMLVRSKNGKLRRVAMRPMPVAVPDLAEDGTPYTLATSAVVYDQLSNRSLYSKRGNAQVSIASITKVMTAIVTLDAGVSLDEAVTIAEEDIDTLKNSRSRLTVGTPFRRLDLMRLALMASDNRAAAALARNYQGGTPGFVRAMNAKAAALGMNSTRFVDSSGLNPENVSTANDLVKLVLAAAKYPVIREFTTTPEVFVTFPDNSVEGFMNSNRLIRGGDWVIDLSKTGYIKESGMCLVMRALVSDRPTVMILLNSEGRDGRIGDANRIRKWIEGTKVASNG